MLAVGMTADHALDLTERRWWHGAVDLEPLPGGGARAWRVPFGDPRYRIGLLWDGTPAGVRITLRTTASRVSLVLRTDRPDPSPVDVVVDRSLRERLPVVPPAAGRTDAGRPVEPDLDASAVVEVTAALPGTPTTVELWLPQYGCSGVERVVLHDDPAPSPVDPRSRRWVTHGSSITMCRQAHGPSSAWPSRVAAALDLELTNLGFGGQCLLDLPVARLIRDTPAELVSLCLGVNVHGHAGHTARTLLPAVMGFVETVLDGHTDVPVVVISPIAARPARDVANRAGLTLTEVRDIVHEGVQRIVEATGADNLHLIDGRDVLGDHQLDLLVDNVHPGDDGSAAMAGALTPMLATLLTDDPVAAQ